MRIFTALLAAVFMGQACAQEATGSDDSEMIEKQAGSIVRIASISVAPSPTEKDPSCDLVLFATTISTGRSWSAFVSLQRLKWKSEKWEFGGIFSPQQTNFIMRNLQIKSSRADAWVKGYVWMTAGSVSITHEMEKGEQTVPTKLYMEGDVSKRVIEIHDTWFPPDAELGGLDYDATRDAVMDFEFGEGVDCLKATIASNRSILLRNRMDGSLFILSFRYRPLKPKKQLSEYFSDQNRKLKDLVKMEEERKLREWKNPNPLLFTR